MAASTVPPPCRRLQWACYREGMRTPLCDMLGIEFPILAFSHCRDVVAAVTKAGGFGVLGAVAHAPSELEIELDWIERAGRRQALRRRPAPARQVRRRRRGRPRPGARARRADPRGAPRVRRRPAGPLRRPAAAGVKRQPPAAPARSSVAQGLPAAARRRVRPPGPAASPTRSARRRPRLVEHAHAHGVLVAALAGNDGARRAHRRAGVDIIVAQGTEAGGHTGEVVHDGARPRGRRRGGARRRCSPRAASPRGRQIAAALALGAEGVWCGSVWLTTEEAETAPGRQAEVPRRHVGRHRPLALARPASRPACCAPRGPTSGTDPQPRPAADAPADDADRRGPGARIDRARRRDEPAPEKLATYFVGQVVGPMNQVKPARQVVLDMVDEFIDAAQSLSHLLE